MSDAIQLFQFQGPGIVLFCSLSHCHGLWGHLNRTELYLMLLAIPALFPLRQVKMSAVEKGHVLTHFTSDLMLRSMSQTLQQEKHVLQRKLDMNELTSGQREAELATDLAALRAELERHHSQGRDRRRDEGEQLTQLANHNQRLVEQLAEVSVCYRQTDSQNPAFKKTSQLCHNAVRTNKILV